MGDAADFHLINERYQAELANVQRLRSKSPDAASAARIILEAASESGARRVPLRSADRSMMLALLAIVSSANPSAGQRLVTMIQYIGSDYRGAVPDGGVVANEFEYAENLQTAREAALLYARLRPDGGQFGALENLRALVEQKAAPEEVERTANAAAQKLRQELNLPNAPLFFPDLQQGARLYAEHCQSCHGTEGRGDGAAAAALNPKPPDMTADAWADARSPFQIFNTVTVGIPGTGMLPFEEKIDASGRWALAFYILTLRPNGPPSEHPWVGVTDLASLTNAQLAAQHGMSLSQADAARRHEPKAFTVAQAMLRMRDAVLESKKLVAENRRRDAADLIAATYYDVIEPVEPGLGITAMPSLALMEKRITELRAAISNGTPVDEDVDATVKQLEAIADRFPDPAMAPALPKPRWPWFAVAAVALAAVLFFARRARKS